MAGTCGTDRIAIPQILHGALDVEAILFQDG
jgi:hypothetical protein